MRKLILLTAVLALLIPAWAFGAGICVQSATKYTDGMVVVKIACTGDDSDGSIPDTAITSDIIAAVKGTHYLYTVSAYPTSGGTAPDAADVFVLDDNGEDLLGSTDGGTTANKGANLIHATLKKTTFPYTHFLSNAYFPAIVGGLTIRVANQATVEANYTLELTFVR